MKTSVHAIEADGLVKSYGDVRALDGLSLAVPAGTIFGLLGPNGAGKSTTVRILSTLSRPDAGTARVAGHDVLDEPAAVRRAIGCVGQRSGVDGDATGVENLRLQGQIHGLRGGDLAARVDELLERFGLSEAGGRFVRTYSGGMQRRLDIAMALVHRPQILFLDEPTTGLDPEVRAELWREIERLTREGLSILLTTHYLEEADRLASELAIVDRGRVVAGGPPERLKAELRGDSIHVELAFAANGAARAALEPLPAIRELVVEGTSLRARADSGARAVPAVLGALEAGGIDVASVTVSRPSLDDVYLRHAGRSFE
jgi:ABC-2 type transport system ATP-binding protein